MVYHTEISGVTGCRQGIFSLHHFYTDGYINSLKSVLKMSGYFIICKWNCTVESDIQ